MRRHQDKQQLAIGRLWELANVSLSRIQSSSQIGAAILANVAVGVPVCVCELKPAAVPIPHVAPKNRNPCGSEQIYGRQSVRTLQANISQTWPVYPHSLAGQ